MSSVSSISPGATTAYRATSSDGSSTASRVPQKTLGQDDFLKLLSTQFKVQDPMKPMEDTAFIAQMAQFSALEQSSSMSQQMTALRTEQQRVTANSYLGHRVTVDAGNGQVDTADVSAVDSSGTEPQLVVNGKNYPLSAVLRVEPSALTTASASQSATAGGA